MGGLEVDSGLLELSDAVLSQNGFTTLRVETELQLLLAEDTDSFVAVAALVAADDMVDAEPLVSRALTQRAVARNLGTKSWDLYTVLLCAQKPDDGHVESLAELSNNLRHVRRLVRVGVDPTLAGLARALRPLMPLPAPHLESGLVDPMASLRTRLVSDGLAEELVSRAFQQYALGGSAGAGGFRADPSDGDNSDEGEVNPDV